jgi:hypothetical protein
LSRHAPDVVRAAKKLSELLGTAPPDEGHGAAASASSSWHP